MQVLCLLHDAQTPAGACKAGRDAILERAFEEKKCLMRLDTEVRKGQTEIVKELKDDIIMFVTNRKHHIVAATETLEEDALHHLQTCMAELQNIVQVATDFFEPKKKQSLEKTLKHAQETILAIDPAQCSIGSTKLKEACMLTSLLRLVLMFGCITPQGT
eukprot:2713434-Amphidinium_carterae.4